MEFANGGIRSIFDDPDYYAKAFKTWAGFASKFEVLAGWVDEVFPGAIAAKLAANVADKEPPLRIMGVGSGTGSMDCDMMAKLSAHFPRIANTVVEPAGSLMLQYKDLAKTKGFDTSGWAWRQQTWRQYMDSRRTTNGIPAGERYHFISTTHALYYMTNWREVLMEMVGCLTEGGMLMIIVVAEDSGCSRFWKRFPALENTTFKFITSGDVQQVLAANGIESELFQQKSSVNIDCCYDKDNSNDAEHVADFLTQALHFQKTAPPDFVEEVLSYVAEPECSFKKGGELYFNNDWAAVVVTKSGVLQQ